VIGLRIVAICGFPDWISDMGSACALWSAQSNKKWVRTLGSSRSRNVHSIRVGLFIYDKMFSPRNGFEEEHPKLVSHASNG
jgi:hypothetical protein